MYSGVFSFGLGLVAHILRLILCRLRYVLPLEAIPKLNLSSTETSYCASQNIPRPYILTKRFSNLSISSSQRPEPSQHHPLSIVSQIDRIRNRKENILFCCVINNPYRFFNVTRCLVERLARYESANMRLNTSSIYRLAKILLDVLIL